MQLIADRVGIDGPHGPLVPQTSLTVASGELVIVKGDPGTGISAFGLALAGRLRPSTGTVTVHDDTDEPATPDDSPADESPTDIPGDEQGDPGDAGNGVVALPEDAEPGDAPTDDAVDTADTDAADTDAVDGGADTGEETGRRAGRSADSPITAPGAVAARVAVVDAPGVSEPDDALPLRVVVGEELALAGRPANKAAVSRW
ncbi:energy-coupling factor transporter ATP-binding protein EcfA2, partial [Prauserella sediminis]|nr:energy-coupling factor transporter ATP-binding protein EcfA2 [Prauserella sediminis]